MNLVYIIAALLLFSPFIIFLLSKIYNKLTFKYYDPYYVDSFFGLPGCGKTTDACKLSLKVNRGKTYYDRIYTNFDCPGAYKYSLEDLIKINKNRDEESFYIPFEPNSIVCLDEAGLSVNGRNFKDFSQFLQVLFRKCRHYKLYLRVYSQAFDTDKTIRNLSSHVFIMKKYLRVFTLVKPVVKEFDIGIDQDGNGSLVETYSYMFILNWYINFIPRYVDLFDSHEVKSSAVMNRLKFSPIPQHREYTYTFFRFVCHTVYIWFLNRIFRFFRYFNIRNLKRLSRVADAA